MSAFAEFIGYGLARFFLPLLSAGRIVVQPRMSTEVVDFNFLGYHRDRQGRIEISSDAVSLISFAIFVILLFTSAPLIRVFS
jgi:hypothetical protein